MREKLSPLQEAFLDVTGQLPTPANVEDALRNPDLKRQIDEQMQAIIEVREADETMQREDEEE